MARLAEGTLPTSPLFCEHKFMTKSIPKRPRGRPPTGTGLLIGMRWHASSLVRVDEWRLRQHDRPSRTEAIRRLVDQALTGSPSGARSARAGARAQELAST